MQQTTTVVLATRNKGKIAELTNMLAAHAIEVQGLDAFPNIGEIEETGETFAENSAIKAEAVSKATGLVAIADDSGLEVDALAGAPGVYSARYSGPDATDEKNNEKLLADLAGLSDEERTARFRCVITAMGPNGETLVADGAWEGRIAQAPAGENGFGYDPLFFDPTAGRTAAQMDKGTKNERSHRGKALARLLESWPDFWKRVSGD